MDLGHKHSDQVFISPTRAEGMEGGAKGTDPGLSVPPCPQPQLLSSPALISPHNQAEPSANLDPRHCPVLCREPSFSKRQIWVEQEGVEAQNSSPSGSLLGSPSASQQGACQ